MSETLSYEQFRRQVSEVIQTPAGNCPVCAVVRMLQGRWKLQILYALCIKNPLRFGELRKMLEGVTNSALTNALRELEKDGLLLRMQYNEIPPHVEYSLTPKGEEANRLHAHFHARMADSAATKLEEGELEALLRSLRRLDSFFHEVSRQNQM